MLQQRHSFRRPGVLFAANAKGQLAADIQRLR
jgi:hypothetical protein